MRKIFIISFLLLILMIFVSCNLFPFFNNVKDTHEQYFYGLTGNWENDSNVTLKFREDGHTFIMSRGIGGEKLSEAQANDLIDFTGFTLKLNNASVDSKGEKTVKKLGSTGYHVVQYFEVIHMDKGEHELYGETLLMRSEEKDIRRNKVFITIE